MRHIPYAIALCVLVSVFAVWLYGVVGAVAHP